MKLKKGDNVLIISGKDRGKTGIIEAVLPDVFRVAVAGINKYKKHVKPSAKNTSGGVIELFRPVHVSKVMLIDSETKKPTRIGYTMENKEKLRVSRLTGKKV